MQAVLISKTEYFPLYETGLFADTKTENGGYYYRRRGREQEDADEFAEMLKTEMKFAALS